ncbi:INCE protein, partial [Todus mexicanus]|nr:INCE protein [Todus mexicanus]
IKNFIRRNTPTRPDLKVKLVRSEFISLQERERQRLESLRKKQEAEEQRRKKVEEEKRRRQAEMKQKREERMKKALQARERVEQMEEEKKKRVEQKILQNDEKARLSQVREEKASEERSKRKLSKKLGEGEGRKQRGLRGGFSFFLLQEEDEFDHQEPLQKRREDEVKERGRKVLELRNLVEQQQVEHTSPWHWELVSSLVASAPSEGPASAPQRPRAGGARWGLSVALVLELHGAAEATCVWWSLAWLGELCPRLGAAARSDRCPPWFQRSISMSCLGPLKGSIESGSPTANEDYGMDLNSDDSTDDESEPRKPVPAWADGFQLNQAILHQYYHPVNVDQIFGVIPSPKLEDIFGKNKPRYFKRTSSAVWHSPP